MTALKGKAQLTRAATQTSLRFKDDLNLRDLIDTQERSLARVLFGGKSTVTVRELSRLEVREELLPGGGTRSIHELSSGSILVNVARSLMRRGDEVQIRTPNAIAVVHGSTIFAQYNAALAQSIFIILTGSAIVTPQGLPPMTLAPLASVNITGTAATGVQAGPVGTVTQAEATEIVDASEVEAAVTEEANQEQTAKVQTEQAAELATAIVEAVTGETLTALQDTQQEAQETVQEVETAGTEQTVETIAQSPPQTAIEQGFTPVVEAASEEPAPSSGGGTVSETLESESVQIAILEGGGTLPATVTTQPFTASALPFIFETDTTSSRSPFFQLSNETLNVSDRLILVKSGANVTLAGKLLDVTNSTLTVGSAALSRRDILRVQDSGTSLSGTGTDPLITVNPSTLTFGRFLDVRGGATVNLAGPLLSDSASTFIVERDFVDVRQLNSKLTGTGTTPLLQFSSSTLNVGTKGIGSTGGDIGDFFRVDDNVSSDVTGPASVTLAGPLVSDTGSTFDILLRFLRVEDGSTFTSTTSDPLIAFSGSTVKTGLDFARLDDSSTVSLSGPLIDALSNTKFTTGTGAVGADFLEIRDSAVFTGPSKPATGDASPLITFDQSTLTTTVDVKDASTRFLDLRLSGKLTLGGPLLKATNSTFTTNADFARITQLATLTGTGTTALFQFTNSTFNIGSDTVQTNGQEPGDNFFRVDDSAGDTVTGAATVTLAGPLVSDSGSTFTIADRFLRVTDGSTLTSTTTSPLITLSGSTVTTDEFTRVDDSSMVTLAGPLVSDSGSTFTISDRFLRVRGSGSTLSSTTTSPLITLSGSTVTTSDEFTRVDDSSTVTLAGPLVSDSGSTFTIADRFLVVRDGSTFTSTTTSPLITLSGSTVNVSDEFVRIDDSAKVTLSGALLSAGSTLDIDRDLLNIRTGGQLAGGHLREVLDLRLVQVRPQLGVDPPEPPFVWNLDREVAA
ncbi:MAG: FecR domain-containing protein [Nitrospirae bacterium]|nr:FecR domain-containing protein [Nitrospirota bacterium]